MNKNRSVLIVSRDTGHFASALTLLEGDGYTVRFLRSNADVLDEVTTRFPDLIISELATIGIDGLELCRKLRRMRPGKYLPILLVGDLSNRSPIVIDASICGGNAYMQKPVMGKALYARCTELLDVRIDAEAPPIRAMVADKVTPFRTSNKCHIPFLQRRSQNEDLSEGYCWVYRGSDKGAVIKVYLPEVDMNTSLIIPFDGSPANATSLIGAADVARSLSKMILDACQLMVVDAGDGKEPISFSLAE